MLKWEALTSTMLQTSCKRYQISRGPLEAGKFTYRAWLRAENKILASVQCYNEAGDRAAAVAECKEACAQHQAENPI